MKPLEIALVCWLIGCATASLLQFAAPRRVAARSVWGIAPGWQREVAAWNFALCLAIVYALVSREESCKILVGQTIAGLSALLGVNHLAALRLEPTLMHTAGILANGLGLALIVWGLLSG